MPHITAATLDRVLARAKKPDPLGRKIAAALGLIEGVLDQLGENAVALSFNGGKDCTVLLHLFAVALYERHNDVGDLALSHASIPLPSPSPVPTPATSNGTTPRTNGTPVPAVLAPAPAKPEPAFLTAPAAAPPPLPICVTRTHTPAESLATATHHTPVDPAHAAPYPVIRSVYFTAPNPFPALEAFVIDSATSYAMDLYRFGGGMKAALEEYLSCLGGREIKAILLGTRNGDPNGNVAELAWTDPSWPQVLRVHPVLDWTYAEVWDFLRELDVPYCKLYDEGYTSLGSTNNTARNPLLQTPSGGWLPAYALTDPSQERAGRNRKPN